MRDYLWCKSKLGFQDFWWKIPRVPPLKYFGNVGLEYPPPLSDSKNLVKTWHFGIWVGLEYPTPRTYVGAGVWRLIAVSLKDTVSFVLAATCVWSWRALVCTCRSEDQLDNTGVNTHTHRAPPNAAETNMPSYHSNSSMNGPTSLYDRNDVSPNPSLQSGNGIPHRTVSTTSLWNSSQN